MSQTLVMPLVHSEVGGSVSVAIESSGQLIVDLPSHPTTGHSGIGPRQRIVERGEILGAIACEVPFQAIIDPQAMTLQSSPVVVVWPNTDTGRGPQPFVALFPSGAIRSVSAILREGVVEFPLPMELIDPDWDLEPGMPFRFELFQFAPHPRDRVIPASPVSQTSLLKEPEASVPDKTKAQLSQLSRTVLCGTVGFKRKRKQIRTQIHSLKGRGRGDSSDKGVRGLRSD